MFLRTPRFLTSPVIPGTALVLAFYLALYACTPSGEPSTGEPSPEPKKEVATLPAEGQTVPAPVFQRGNELVPPLADGSAFVSFMNATYLIGEPQIENLTDQDVVWFPPQTFGDTSLEAVHRDTAADPKQCDDPSGYPILCKDDFSSADLCQTCHDSALFVAGGGLPAMTYLSEDEQWLANWTQYGDWSASIMALAARDPIWQAQIETETNVHDGVDPALIEDICFRCHGAMGERQLQTDYPNQEPDFCTDVFYATIPGIVPATNRGKSYPFSDSNCDESFPASDCCAPIDGKSVKDHPKKYAKYGSLARDGVSCEVCHRLGPMGEDSGAWDGSDYTVFYGPVDDSILGKQDNPWPLNYDFTATFEYDKDSLMTPDLLKELDVLPMQRDDEIELAHAIDTKNNVSYLRQSILCGSCHVLIVPKIPTDYAVGVAVPESKAHGLPYYERPEGCEGENLKFTGNPVTDPCVAVSYEQATYLEWINSSFASEEDNDNTCQGCHMPFVTDPANASNHGALMAQANEKLIPKQYRRHQMMGINAFVFEMYAQFPDVLGVNLYDAQIPTKGTATDGTSTPFIRKNLLNGEMSIVEQATSQANGNGLDPVTGQPMPQASAEIEITSLNLDGQHLTAELLVVNNTGHKFPSGAGFRRAFLQFEVLDVEGNVLWVSGAANPFGAICDGPCKQTGDTYNLLPSETASDPRDLQPHYATIKSQSQVQIYEVQAVDDTGKLTSSTLALFHDAKDNRILPRGWTPAATLGCDEDPNAGTMIFGIPQCSAAGGTAPQTDPLTKHSAIATDKHYSDSSLTGSDAIEYKIAVPGPVKPASVRVTLKYQTIPPGYLAARFKDGYDTESQSFLPATERAIYLTSHLNTDLGLTSTHPDNSDLPLTDGWTMNIHQAVRAIAKQ